MNIILILHLVYSFKGLLSKVNFKLSSEVNFDSSSPVEEKNQNIIKYLKNNIYSNKKYQDSHYYLTNQPYKYCYTIYQNEKTKNTEYIKYFDFNQMKDQMWYKAYALDWISQINFFHKFLNNRIIYVTGSTGVGKSTQIPKLLLYAMKALSYNESGRLVCTQPRTTPTKNNALQVSKELGVPIEIPTVSDNNRENYYVQYKYRGENKTKNVGHLSLRFVTDGSLNIELANPLLKKVIKGGYQNHDIFIQENMYDIVAVDEAHEHNTNMDMILTYMRYVAHYNNSIKLVIISATMDDDEPIYRRYYRNVNDNLMYPLNYNLKNYSIDRINVDRRECRNEEVAAETIRRRCENVAGETGRIRCDCDCVFECLLELLEDANNENNHCRCNKVRPGGGENRRRCECVFACLIDLLEDALAEDEDICCRRR